MPDTVKNERCYGIDLLKALAMFMVVVLHILGRGGVLSNASSVNYWVAWLMECAAYCAVDCFALATGFLMAGRSLRYRKMLPMWLTVVCYSVGLTLLGWALDPSMKKLEIVQAFFPVSSKVYWYFSSYFCLFFFIPFLNILVETLSEKKYRTLLWTGFLLFSGVYVLGLEGQSDPFKLLGGYSPIWLMYLYLLGAGIKKHGYFTSLSWAKALLGYLGAVMFSFLWKLGMDIVIGKEIPVLASLCATYGSGRFIAYISPTIVMSAVCLSVFCLKLQVPKWLRPVLKWMSPLLLQVYIIHVHPTVWARISGRFGSFADYPIPVMVLLVLGTAFGIFLGCLLIDWVRQQLFRLIRVDRWADKIGKRTKEGAKNG